MSAALYFGIRSLINLHKNPKFEYKTEEDDKLRILGKSTKNQEIINMKDSIIKQILLDADIKNIQIKNIKNLDNISTDHLGNTSIQILDIQNIEIDNNILFDLYKNLSEKFTLKLNNIKINNENKISIYTNDNSNLDISNISNKQTKDQNINGNLLISRFGRFNNSYNDIKIDNISNINIKLNDKENSNIKIKDLKISDFKKSETSLSHLKIDKFEISSLNQSKVSLSNVEINQLKISNLQESKLSIFNVKIDELAINDYKIKNFFKSEEIISFEYNEKKFEYTFDKMDDIYDKSGYDIGSEEQSIDKIIEFLLSPKNNLNSTSFEGDNIFKY